MAVICFLLYKWRKNRQELSNVTSAQEQEYAIKSDREIMDKDIDNHEQEVIQIPENENKSNDEPIENNVHNHGQEAIPTAGAGDEKVSLQSIDK